MDAAPPDVVDSIDASQRSYRKSRCRSVQLCDGSRARNWSFVLDKPPSLLPMVAVGAAYPEQDGGAHGTLVRRIRVRSVERDVPWRLGIA